MTDENQGPAVKILIHPCWSQTPRHEITKKHNIEPTLPLHMYENLPTAHVV